ncbi:MAG: acyl carrier protein [Burkholderiales bacterium]|nr:acyl carrier protein [Nitrosomonas sp.]MCP5273507.1 acyl carrier protein [Burkholderiales bacterium]
MQHLEEVKKILCEALDIPERMDSLTENSNLLGSIPELDSMSVVNVITALEEHFNLSIDDEEINEDIFKTLGSLSSFIDQKLQNS